MGKLTISMAIFNSYVSLPEGSATSWVHLMGPSKHPVEGITPALEKSEVPAPAAVCGVPFSATGAKFFDPWGSLGTLQLPEM